MKQDFFLRALALAMAASSVVMIEPAPVDIAIALLTVAAVAFRRVVFRREHDIPFVCVAAFILANLVSMASAADTYRAAWFAGVTTYLAVSMFFFLGVVCRYGEKAVEALMTGYVFSGLLSAGLAIGAFFGMLPFQDALPLLTGSAADELRRPTGLFKDPNVFGPYLIPVCLYAFTKMHADGTVKRKLGWVAVFAIAGAAVFLSFSRACWLNFLVSMAVYGLLGILTEQSSQLKLRWAARIAAATCIALVVVAVVMRDERVSTMLGVRVAGGSLQDYDADRFLTQRAALQTARENILGLGPGQSEGTFQYATHSSYVRVVVENGILGFLSFCGLLLLSLLRAFGGAWKGRDRFWREHSRLAAATLSGLIVNSTVIDSIHWRHLWLLLGLAWATQWAPASLSVTHLQGRRNAMGVPRVVPVRNW